MKFASVQAAGAAALDALRRGGSWLSCHLLTNVRFPTGNGLLVRDANLRVILCSVSLTEEFGRPDGLTEGSVMDHFRPDVAHILSGLDEAALGSQQACTGYLPIGSAATMDKSKFRVVTTPVYDDEGRLEGVVTVFAELTELILAEQASYASDVRYRQLWSGMPLAAIVLRVHYLADGVMDLRLTDANPAFLALIQDRELPLEANILDHWPAFRDACLLEKIAGLMSGGYAFKHEMFSGLLGRTLDLSVARFNDNLVLIVAEDVTETRQTQQNVLQVTAQSRVSLAEQQKRSEILLEDANQFMHVVSERFDNCAAQLTDLADRLPMDAAAEVKRTLMELQATSEKMLRYASVGMLPYRAQLEDLQALLDPVFVELAAQYPLGVFKCDPLPRMVVSQAALVSILKNLIELVFTDDQAPAGRRRITLRSEKTFIETHLVLEFGGFQLEMAESLTGTVPIDVNWDTVASLRLAVVRRILAIHGGKLQLVAGPNNIFLVQIKLGSSLL